MAEISERLFEVLKSAVVEGDPVIIEALGETVAMGSLPWFVEEFEQALRAGAFTPQWWGKNFYNSTWTDEEADEMDEDLRNIWNAVAPGRPYPLDSPSS